MIADTHATSQLTGEVGIGQVLLLHLGALVVAKDFRCNHGRQTGVFHDESLLVITRHVSEFSVPESVSIVTIERQNLAKFGVSAELWPTRASVDGHIQPCLVG